MCRVQSETKIAVPAMTEVFVHVYDVTNSASAKTNSAIVQLNKVLRDGMGVGGIFHSAVEVYDNEEWSFGYCETGSGVFSCSPKVNPMYSYRETLSLGRTSLSRLKVTQILCELGREWPGFSYDLLSRNCNHFCDTLCERLGVKKLPAWVNRFAHAGDAAVEVAETTIKRLRQAKTDLVAASKGAYRFFMGSGSASCASFDAVAAAAAASAAPVNDDANAASAVTAAASNKNATNVFRLSFFKSPATFLSRNCLGFQEQPMVDNTQVERIPKA